MTAEPIPAYLQPVQYIVTCKCLRCNHLYKKRVSEKHYQQIVTGRRQDPPCPKKACREALIVEDFERRQRNSAKIISEQKAPGQTGSNFARAADYTANAVMNDYNLTNLRDDNRPNESSVPRLPPAQQEAADNFFGGAQKLRNPLLQMQLQRATMAAQSGILKPQSHNAIDRVLGAKQRVPVKILNK